MSTPSGRPASARIAASAQHRQRGLSSAGLITIVQPAATAGPILRVPMAIGKFHGVMSRQTPTGCFWIEEPAGPVRGDRVAAVDPDGLLGEPAEELRGVGDLALRLGERLAHLEGHQQRQVVDPLDDQLVGAAQDLAALARGPSRRRPAARRRRRPARPCRPRARRRPPRSAPRPVAGSSTGRVAPDSAGRHDPPMNRPVGTCVEDPGFVARRSWSWPRSCHRAARRRRTAPRAPSRRGDCRCRRMGG